MIVARIPAAFTVIRGLHEWWSTFLPLSCLRPSCSDLLRVAPACRTPAHEERACGRRAQFRFIDGRAPNRPFTNARSWPEAMFERSLSAHAHSPSSSSRLACRLRTGRSHQHGPLICTASTGSDGRCRAAPTRCTQSDAARRVRGADAQAALSTQSRHLTRGPRARLARAGSARPIRAPNLDPVRLEHGLPELERAVAPKEGRRPAMRGV